MFRREERKYDNKQKGRKGREFVGVSSLFKRAAEEEERLRKDWGAKSNFFNWTQRGRKFPSFIAWQRREEERLRRRKERRVNKRLREKREEGALKGVEHVFKVRTYVRKRRTAFREKVIEYEVEVLDSQSVWNQMVLTRGYVREVLREQFNKLGSINFREMLLIRFKKPLEDGVFQESIVSVRNRNLTRLGELGELLDEVMKEISGKLTKYDVNGSGWVFGVVLSHDLHVSENNPTKGSSYLELPKSLRHNMKGLINIVNDDEKCFLWCHVRHLNPQEGHSNRVKKEDMVFVEKLNYRGIRFPVEISQIGRVEKQNEICVNVFGYANRVVKLRQSKETYKDVLNLLLIERDGKSHYVLIKDFSRLMFNKTKDRNKKHFCERCFQNFSSDKVLMCHKKDCIIVNGGQATKMPKEGTFACFKNHNNRLQAPFVIYADFESILPKRAPSGGEGGEGGEGGGAPSGAYQEHIACGFSYKVVCSFDDKHSRPLQGKRGKDVVYDFLNCLLYEEKRCAKILRETNKPIVMTTSDKADFLRSERCYICGKAYEEGVKRVRDHCHLTGKYRGSAHESCNLNLKVTKKIPIVFHNLRGYDGHLIMQQISRICKKESWLDKNGKRREMSLTVTPNNMEKYISFTMGWSLVFIDSLHFLNSSLGSLVSSLEPSDFKYLTNKFGERTELMKRKGVYPYEYMDSFERFEEDCLPSKSEFFSSLTGEGISDEDYDHAREVWKAFGMRNMGDYHDHYMGADVLLLADVFESFRKSCLKNYGLDPCHYVSSPGMAWDAMLKMTGVKLELLSDPDKHNFIEKGIRGGTSFIGKRHSKANNPMVSDFDKEKPTSFITYLDANNLYGWAMSKPLPTGGFEWLSDLDLLKLQILLSVGGDTSDYVSDTKSLILEVDLEYPDKIHDHHNDFPLAPQKLKIERDLQSDYCKSVSERHGVPTGLVPKLVTTLHNKTEYVLHYENLVLYLSLGLKLKNIHRALSFEQSQWLKPYIDFNTQRRKEAKSKGDKFGDSFFKLMNNAVFGKTMENVRNRQKVRLVTNEKNMIKILSRPTFESCKIFSENLVAVKSCKEVLYLNKPIYVGMTILDTSKCLMYDFHYNHIKAKYGSKARLLFTDTDSLCYEVETKDVYEDFWSDKHLFDFSGYDKGSKYWDDTNKKVVGKFKDETDGVPIVEFVGLRSKMYSFEKMGGESVNRAKGVKKCVVSNVISHKDYRDTLLGRGQMRHKMTTIRSDRHRLWTCEVNKVSLSCFDDKRYVLPSGVDSYAYGHWRINSKGLHFLEPLIRKMLGPQRGSAP